MEYHSVSDFSSPLRRSRLVIQENSNGKKTIEFKRITKNDAQWIEKHRPSSLDDIVLTPDMQSIFNLIDTNNSIPHLLFYGPPGTSKTTTIRAIGNKLFGSLAKYRVIEYNASNDRGIGVIRDSLVKQAARYFIEEIDPKTGRTVPGFQLIIMDEADALTNDAQEALRVTIESSSSTTRMAFLANRIDKLIAPIKSRCKIFKFCKRDRSIVHTCLTNIMKKENMLHFISQKQIDLIVELSKGDIRRGIVILQNVHSRIYYNIIVGYVFDKIDKSEIEKCLCKELTPEDEFGLINTYKNLNHRCLETNNTSIITTDDIYESSNTISKQKIIDIMDMINGWSKDNGTVCTKYMYALNIVNMIIGMAYPVSHIIEEIKKYIIDKYTDNKLTVSKIIISISKVHTALINSGDERLQLLSIIISLIDNKLE